MPGPFPDIVHGGVVVRDSDGTPVSPGSVSVTNVYTPAPAFQMTCPQTAYPDDPCLFQVRGAQLNMIDSQLLALAQCWSSTGPYDCTDPTALCYLFTKWVSDTLPGLVASTFNDCAGDDHVPGASIPSCAEMNAAISTAIDAAKPKMCDGSTITAAVRLMDVATLTAYNSGYAFGADGAGSCPALIDWYWDQGTQSLTGGRVHNGNSASGFTSFVGNGVGNAASGDYSTVGGGTYNTASGGYDTVAGGSSNTASGTFSFVGGGASNTASGYIATIGGGNTNTASGAYATVGGGYNNLAQGARATIGGGESNNASGDYSTIGGGLANTASGNASTIAGGYQNNASGLRAAIGGGEANRTLGSHDVVAGGLDNTITSTTGLRNTIGGGEANRIQGRINGRNTIGGGISNLIESTAPTNAIIGGFIGGGSNNRIRLTADQPGSGSYSAILGGLLNEVRGYLSTVIGGYGNQIGVSGNQGAAVQSAILGGQNNELYVEASTANGTYNFGSVVLGSFNIATAGGSGANLVAIGYVNRVRGNNRMAFGANITASNAAGTAQDNSVYIAGPGQQLGFYNVPAVARQTLPAVPTVAQIATALRNLGLIA